MSDSETTAEPPDITSPYDFETRPKNGEDFETQLKNREKVFGILLEKLKPWLFEFGSWVFGGLLAFNFVILAPMLNVGPEHPAILVSIATLVCALPLNVSGLFALRLIKDMNDLSIDDMMRQAFIDADVVSKERPITGEHATLIAERTQSLYKQRTDTGLRYALRVAMLSMVLTVVGVIAALWYIAWWEAVLFVVAVIVTGFITFSLSGQLVRPESEKERELRRRYREERDRQQRPQPPRK